MKKIILLLFIIGAVTFGAWWVKQNVGDLRPALMPVIKSNRPQNVTSVPPKRGKPMPFDLTVADGFQIGVFAEDLGAVRDLVFSPGGVLIGSITGSGKIVALPDNNNDGIADDVITILNGLDRPHGIAFYKDKLYIAEESHVSRYIWAEKMAAGGNVIVARFEKKLFNLPTGGRHFTRSLAIQPDGTLYVSIGSTCDVCFEKDPFISSVIVSDTDGKTPRLFAKGLRNAPFITLNPATNEIWGTEMGRDFLGDNLPPDEVNIIKDGKDYGWPVCYGDKVYDRQFGQRSQSYCETTESPAYKIPAHSAPLGLTFINSQQFPSDWQGDVLVSYHGSWNSSTPKGYKVVRLDVSGNSVSGEEDFISGFLQGGTAIARPVDVEFDKGGNLYVSDDKSGYVFVVSKE